MDVVSELTVEQILERLRVARVGRVAVSLKALPHVFLAPMVLWEPPHEDPELVVAVDPVTAVAESLRDAVVAVHADGDEASGGIWQILVQGRSQLIGDGAPSTALPLLGAPDGQARQLASVATDRLQGWIRPAQW